MRIVQRIIAPIGRRVDEASPMVDARLPDGSRVNVIIPPLAPKGAAITIRKFRVDRLSLGDLVQAGSLSEDMGTLLAGCVRAKLNMVVSGGAGSGKTTLLNALTAFMGESERIVTVEDPVELRVQRQHVIQLEVRPPSLEGTGEVSQRDLVRNCLRMRPDRIIVGEVRGAEAFDMLQAMNTGHEGSLTTAHANAPRDALARIENMVLMAGFDIGLTAVRSQIASALNVIVHVSRLSDGSRKVVRITEVAGMEGNVVSLQDIFAFKQTGVSSAGHVEGSLRPTGIRPRFLERLSAFGVNLSESMFKTKGDS
jgi:pilus assembly protein CpaF